jgi:hypothetical protein
VRKVPRCTDFGVGAGSVSLAAILSRLI